MYDHVSALRTCAAHYHLSAFVPRMTMYIFHARTCICAKLSHTSALSRLIHLPHADRTCLSSTFMRLIYAQLTYMDASFKVMCLCFKKIHASASCTIIHVSRVITICIVHSHAFVRCLNQKGRQSNSGPTEYGEGMSRHFRCHIMHFEQKNTQQNEKCLINVPTIRTHTTAHHKNTHNCTPPFLKILVHFKNFHEFRRNSFRHENM